jgi:hypothetical protein
MRTSRSPSSGSAEPDFFKFSGLEGLQTFTLVAERTGALNAINSPVTLTGTIPGDGMLIFEASGGEGVNYEVTLSAPLLVPVPEPSTLALAALGAALTGVFDRRRRKVRGGTTS